MGWSFVSYKERDVQLRDDVIIIIMAALKHRIPADCPSERVARMLAEWPARGCHAGPGCIDAGLDEALVDLIDVASFSQGLNELETMFLSDPKSATKERLNAVLEDFPIVTADRDREELADACNRLKSILGADATDRQSASRAGARTYH